MLTVIAEGIVYSLLNIAKARVLQAWDGDRLTFVDNVTAAIVPTNSDTVKIGYNQRFIISDPKRYPPVVYQVSKLEDTQPHGLTTFKFTQETFDPAHDNAELGICNYYDSPITPEVPDPSTELQQTATITYSGTKPTIKVGGSSKMSLLRFLNGQSVMKMVTSVATQIIQLNMSAIR